MNAKIVLRYLAAAIIVVVISTLITIQFHGEIKQYKQEILTWAPILFACNLFVMFGLALMKSPTAKKLRNMMLAFTLVTLFAPWAALKAEVFGALFEARRGTTVDEVVQMINQDDNHLRYRAWARMVSMSQEQKTVIARELAQSLMSDNAGERHSAILTFENPLKKFKLTAIATLEPALQQNPPQPYALAFVRNFVRTNAPTISSLLDPKKSGKMSDEETIRNLLLSLTYGDRLGAMLLERFTESDNPKVQYYAQYFMTRQKQLTQ